MGGCATKHREAEHLHRGREADAVGKSLSPVESNESVLQQPELEAENKQKSEFGCVEEAAFDDQGNNRRRSLSLLFMENEGQKGSSEEQLLLLTVPEKQEELSKTESQADRPPEAKALLVDSSRTEDADSAFMIDKLEDVHFAAASIEKDDTLQEKEVVVKEEIKQESIEAKEIAKLAPDPAPVVVKGPKENETTEDTGAEKEKELKDGTVGKKEIVKEEGREDELVKREEEAGKEEKQ